MSGSSASWYRVVSGLRLVASAATDDASRRATGAASALARHGAGTAESARTAARAAGISVPTIPTPTPTPMMATPLKKRPTMGEQPSPPVTEWATPEAQTERIVKSIDGTARGTGTDRCVTTPEESIDPSVSTVEPTEAFESSSDEVADAEVLRSISPGEEAVSPAVPRDGAECSLDSRVDSTTRADVSSGSAADQDDGHDDDDDRPDRMREGRPVPSTRLGRAAGFASLGVGLAAGTAAEVASRLLGGLTSSSSSSDDASSSSIRAPSHSPVASDANADRLADALCRMRGAALKLGQMLSIQDSTMLPPPLVRALEQVRKGADAMPRHQLEEVMESELGYGWRDRLASFDDLPFAAASIGQVHRARLGEAADSMVAMKVQYPGVAESIDSDLNNLTMLMKLSGMAPPGLFLEEVIRVGRMELKAECDYEREMANQRRFKALVESDEELVRDRVAVPGVIEDLTTSRIITSKFVRGGTVDRVSDLEQEERNRIGRAILRLTMRELFEWRFMQTDPNWGNFLYDMGTRTTTLIDFGAARDFDKSFVDGYLKIVWANANRDEQTLMDESHRMGFLTGEENDIMMEAHKLSGFTVGEPFANGEPYDFRRSNISKRISEASSAFLQHRLTPPPEEVYTLHRKLAGAYNLCIKLGAVIPCRDLLEEVMMEYSFDDAADVRGDYA